MLQIISKKNKNYVGSVSSRGFTLIEILLIMAITVGIFVFSSPYTVKFYNSNLVEESRSGIIDALLQARHNAVLQKNDSDFGVKINNDAHNYVLFQGSTYDSREDTLDDIYYLLDAITVSEPTEIVFSKLTGVPSATGTITITYGNFVKEISIDDSGLVYKVD